MKRFNKIVTVGLLIAPLLSIYTTNILSFTYFDFFLIFISLVILFRNRIIHINRPLLSYGMMIFFLHLLTIFEGNVDLVNTSLRMLRYLFYILFLSLFTIGNFNVEYGEKVYRLISLLASVFLFIQLFCFSIFRRYIPGFLTFLPLSREEMLWHATNYQNRFLQDPRPRSFFSEPQIFATYILGYLAILLFKDNWNKKDKRILIVLFAAVLVSRSTTAIVCLVFLLGMFLLHRVIQKKINPSILSLLFFAVIAMVLIAPDLYSSRLSFTSHSVTGRLEGYLLFINKNGTLFSNLFGQGMIDIDTSTASTYTVFIPSLLRLYKYYGGVGCIIIIIIFIGLIKNVRHEYRPLLYLVFFLMIGTVDFFGIMIFTSMPFIITSDSNRQLTE